MMQKKFVMVFAPVNALHSAALCLWPDTNSVIQTNSLPATSTAAPPFCAPPAQPPPPLSNYFASADAPAYNIVPGAFAMPSLRLVSAG